MYYQIVMMKKILAHITLLISFFTLWYIGNLADKAQGSTLEGGNSPFTFSIIFLAVIIIFSALYIGEHSKKSNP